MASQKQIEANRRNAKQPGSGRPKGYAALQAEIQRKYVAEVLAKEFAPIVQKAVEQAKVGDKAARDWLSEFAFGKPTQPITGANGDPLFTPTDADRAFARKALLDLLD